MLTVAGPRSRELLQRLSRDDFSNEGFRFFRARRVDVAKAPVLALRVSYVGELGWELHHPIEHQKFVAPFVPYDYRIVTKSLKRFADGSIKGNFDVEMAIDMVSMAGRVDVIAIVSGDADFARAVEDGVRQELRAAVAFAKHDPTQARHVEGAQHDDRQPHDGGDADDLLAFDAESHVLLLGHGFFVGAGARSSAAESIELVMQGLEADTQNLGRARLVVARVLERQ